MSELSHAHTTVEHWFAQHGASADEHRVEIPEDVSDQLRAWSVRFSDVDISIAVEQMEAGVSVQVTAEILQATQDTHTELWPALLRLNREALVGCAYALDEDGEVVVVAERGAAEVSADAFAQLVERVHDAAVTFTAELAARFGAVNLLTEEE